MQVTQADTATVWAADPCVNDVCNVLVERAARAVRGIEDVDALWIAGSLARGEACGTLIKGKAYVLSDVDGVVVPRPNAAVQPLRERLAEIAEKLTESSRSDGFLSHLDLGVISQRAVQRPQNKLFLHDVARHGKTVWGDRRPLERLQAGLRGRRVDPNEGRILALNRIAGQLFMLDHFASDNAMKRLLARFHFAKVYADNEIALRVVRGAYHRPNFRHTVLDKHAEQIERWRVFRRTPLADPGTGEQLFAEWIACARDQLEVAAACRAIGSKRGSLRLKDAMEWSRVRSHRPALRERFGLGGSPLEVAHDRCVELMRRLVDGAVDDGHAWAERVHEAVGLWRVALTGINDTRRNFARIVGPYIEACR